MTVCESLQGDVTLLRNNKILPYSTLRLGRFHENIEDAKTINARVDSTIVHFPTSHIYLKIGHFYFGLTGFLSDNKIFR